MKNILGIFILLASFVMLSPAWSTTMAPDQLVDETVHDVLDILKNDSGYAEDKEKMLDLVESEVLPHFNFNRMSQLAMGRHWSDATAEQQASIVEEFRTLLVRTYSNALTKYKDEKVDVHKSADLGGQDDVTVRTMVIQGSGKQPVPIDYSMEKKPDGWKIYDVTVAGVSLVTNYRGSFNSQVRKGGIDGLIKTLADKNKSLEGK